ncbi:MAG: tRNA-dihydrouridine synthase family protein [Bacteroides sp.]|nr:tRNA-dihydrouridine synthase family protein [Bacteroides sp.]
MKKEKLPIHFAPLQGYTDAIYRQAHARIFGGIASYYTPFVRIEHGDFRRKDVRELEAENNRGVVLTPQLIASTPETILHILSLFIEKGYKNVDINLGCPFPTLTKRHNGAGLLPYPDEVKALLSAAIESHPDIRFSVKMRLGWEDAAECMALLPLLNSLPLSHITMHPRLGKQQYKGEVDLEAFQRFYAECEKPLVYNGDLLTLDDIERIESRFPRLAGLMIGRGLLANPALAIEYQQGAPLSLKEKIEKIRLLHADVFSQYGNLLEGGEQQLLTKMRTFWEYLLPDGDRKAKKVIHKTSKLSNYQAAVSNLLR